MVFSFFPVKGVPDPCCARVEFAEFEGGDGREGDAFVGRAEDDVEWQGRGRGREEVGEDGLCVGGCEGGE